MHGNKYRLESTKTGGSPASVVVRSGSHSDMGGNALTTVRADQEEAEAMLRGLTLPQLVRDVRAFNEKFGLPLPAKPTGLSDDLYLFRRDFMIEELDEFQAACNLGNQPDEALDALVDLVYVAIGTALVAGWDFEEAWRRVHRANMRKVPAKSADESKRGHALDVVKPPGWVAPDLSDLVK